MRYKPFDRKDVMRRIKDYVWKKHNFRRQDLTAKDVAEELGISRSAMMEIFKEEEDSTFLTYLNDCRVRYSRKLLMQNHGRFHMEHIQALCGFGSLGTFFEKYNAKYGELPAETDERQTKSLENP